MTTFRLKERWAEINGKYELLNKPTDVKIKSLKNICGTGWTWHFIWRDGMEQNSLYSSSGKERFIKKDLKVEIIK